MYTLVWPGGSRHADPRDTSPWPRFQSRQAGSPACTCCTLTSRASTRVHTSSLRVSRCTRRRLIRFLPKSIVFSSTIFLSTHIPNHSVPRQFVLEPNRHGVNSTSAVAFHCLTKAYEIIRNSRAVLFGVAVERGWLSTGENEYLYALESIARRFDEFLRRQYRLESDPQRGLIIVAESQFRQRIEALALRIQQQGTRWGEIWNLSELPLFTSAANSRMLQLADLCANAVYARYATGHARHFDRIAPRFDASDRVFHGLWHASRDHQTCTCPGCLTRRIANAD